MTRKSNKQEGQGTLRGEITKDNASGDRQNGKNWLSAEDKRLRYLKETDRQLCAYVDEYGVSVGCAQMARSALCTEKITTVP